MKLDDNLKKILKEMWRIDEKKNSGEELTSDEQNFFNDNLNTIKDYYDDNHHYWDKKEKI